MKKETVTIPGIKNADYPFSHVVKAGNTLYLTSQLSCDLETGEIIPGTIEVQTRNALGNVKYLLEKADSSLNNILKVVVYMRNVAEFDKMNEVYKEYFNNGEEPARVTVQAASPIKEIDIEIEVVALTN